jgi:predicted RNA-binding protein with RPS1 domain
LSDELLPSFDHLKSLSTSKQRENNTLLQKRHLCIAGKFVKDPQVVKVEQVTKVKVLEVDEKRKRITLTMRLTDAPASQTQEARGIGKREQPRDRKDRSADFRRNGKPDLIQQWLRRLRG